jgi:outer membrane lipoprotein SlyB
MRIHPLMAGAAVSVMALSGVGIAAMTGHLPGSRAEKAPPAAEAPLEKSVAAAPSAEAKRQHKASVSPEVTAKQVASAPAAKPAQPAACAACGVVVAVRTEEKKGKGTGLGAVIGGVAGAVVGHGITDGKDAGTIVGAAGGAVAGHQMERHARATQRFHVDVRMADGTVKTVTSDTAPAWKSGDRVRLQNGQLLARR